jgi:hypothetical protein
VEDDVETRRLTCAAGRWRRKTSRAGVRAAVRWRRNGRWRPGARRREGCSDGCAASRTHDDWSSGGSTTLDVVGRGHAGLARRVYEPAPSLIALHDGRQGARESVSSVPCVALPSEHRHISPDTARPFFIHEQLANLRAWSYA